MTFSTMQDAVSGCIATKLILLVMKRKGGCLDIFEGDVCSRTMIRFLQNPEHPQKQGNPLQNSSLHYHEKVVSLLRLHGNTICQSQPIVALWLRERFAWQTRDSSRPTSPYGIELRDLKKLNSDC